MYPEVATSGKPGEDPTLVAIHHYLKTGAKEGRSPSPFFDPKYYLATHADLIKSL
jgi:hypothetical protein